MLSIVKEKLLVMIVKNMVVVINIDVIIKSKNLEIELLNIKIWKELLVIIGDYLILIWLKISIEIEELFMIIDKIIILI